MPASPLSTPFPAQQHLRSLASLPLAGPQLLLAACCLRQAPWFPPPHPGAEWALTLDWLGDQAQGTNAASSATPERSRLINEHRPYSVIGHRVWLRGCCRLQPHPPDFDLLMSLRSVLKASSMSKGPGAVICLLGVWRRTEP